MNEEKIIKIEPKACPKCGGRLIPDSVGYVEHIWDDFTLYAECDECHTQFDVKYSLEEIKEV